MASGGGSGCTGVAHRKSWRADIAELPRFHGWVVVVVVWVVVAGAIKGTVERIPVRTGHVGEGEDSLVSVK
jgi:hypothetical protein